MRRPGGRVDEARLRAMVERLAHRGPDGIYTHVSADGHVGLAHARLSIVDLSPRGNQPMTNEDATLWLSCNGEVYNHAELRAHLLSLGHRFRSDSDNEVLLHGFEEWGLDVLQRVRGMFAFALAEPAKGTVLLARDRLGEKPLALLEDEMGLLAASEIPALIESGRVRRETDPRALAYFLSRNLRHVPDPLSVFRHVRKVRPGHVVTIRDGRVVDEEMWWRPTWSGPRISRETFLGHVRDAVELQAQADVEVGALLSGGVDSSVVVGLASGRGRLRTYALGRDTQDEELARARAAAQRFGTHHHEANFDPSQLERLDVLIGQLGEPIALLPLTHADALLRLVAQDGLRVVMTGNGADELLWGYHGVPRLRLASALMRLSEPIPRAALASLSRMVTGRARRGLRLLALPLPQRKIALYRDAVQGVTELLRPEWRDEAAMPRICPVFSPWADVFDGRDFVELSQFLTLVVEDAHSVTISADVAGMHHSVEVRNPFLDGVVVDAGLRLPIREKAGGVFRPEGKRVLKRGFRPLIGREVGVAPKMGFGFALQESELIRGPFRVAISDRILNGEGVREYFDARAIRRRVEDHMDGRRDHGKLLLSLYAFETWYRTFVS